MNKKIVYKRHKKFTRQIGKLIRKYPSLEEDLLEAQKSAIELFHIYHLDNYSVELIPKFDHKIIQIYKIRKFACKALKGKGVRSGIRIIYAFFVEKNEVEFLEIYYKEKDDSDMDYKFIEKYLQSLVN